jgi:transposase
MEMYDKVFKEEAVKLALDIGAPKASKDLDVPINTLYTWLSRAKAHGERAHVGSGNKRNNSGSSETAQLIKRNKELERANQILKEALGFFAVSQKK